MNFEGQSAELEPREHQLDFFRLLECGVNHIDQCASAFDRIRSGDLQGVLVHGGYDLNRLAGLVARLEDHDPAFLKTWFPDVFRSWFYGRNLNLTGPDLDGYFAEAKQFEHDLDVWSQGGEGLMDTLGSMLASLDHGVIAKAPHGPNAGQRYMITTLRGHDVGGYIPAHCDNEFLLRPAYRHLAQLCEPHIISFVFALSAGDAGGETEIFDFRQSFKQAQLMSDDRFEGKPDLTTLPVVGIRIPTGSMLVFDSGRYLHRLAPLQGGSRRWTACSFMARAKDRSANYCWG